MKKYVLAFAACGAIATFGGGLAIAQVATEEFTLESMPSDAPFGELPMEGYSTDNVAQIVENMSAPQRDELQKRCTVIIANGDVYGTANVDFCNAASEQITSTNEDDAEDAAAEDAAQEPTEPPATP
jgi:hypothetical protein